MKGKENLCERAVFTGYTIDGGYAEYLVAHEQYCFPLSSLYANTYNYTSWTRSFSLPEDVIDGKISAEYKNGELKIEVPKDGEKKKNGGKHIEIR